MEKKHLTSREVVYILHVLSKYYLHEVSMLIDPTSDKAQRLKELSSVIRLLSTKFPYE